jgi:DNA-binding NtrC family response regulator
MVRQGLFREDLFYRLSTITLHVPPLRDREGDIELLVRYFVGQLNERFGCRKEVGEAALEVLRRHGWPGNVRELKHVVEAALVVCDGQEVRPEHLPAAVRQARIPAAASRSTGAIPTLEELERDHIRLVLDTVSGHRGQAAKALGISERNLYRKLRECGWLS